MEQPIVLSEFGGVASGPSEQSGWGYSRAETAERFAEIVLEMLGIARSLSALAGFCYAQFTDTYQEQNGLLRADRTPKIPLADIAAALGPRRPSDYAAEWTWRERLMNRQREQYIVPAEDYLK